MLDTLLSLPPVIFFLLNLICRARFSPFPCLLVFAASPTSAWLPPTLVCAEIVNAQPPSASRSALVLFRVCAGERNLYCGHCVPLLFSLTARDQWNPTYPESSPRTTLHHTPQRTSHLSTPPKLTLPLPAIPHLITPHYKTLPSFTHRVTRLHAMPVPSTPLNSIAHCATSLLHTTPQHSTAQASTSHPTFSFPILSSRVQFTSTTFALFSSLPRRFSSLPFSAHNCSLFLVVLFSFWVTDAVKIIATRTFSEYFFGSYAQNSKQLKSTHRSFLFSLFFLRVCPFAISSCVRNFPQTRSLQMARTTGQ